MSGYSNLSIFYGIHCNSSNNHLLGCSPDSLLPPVPPSNLKKYLEGLCFLNQVGGDNQSYALHVHRLVERFY